MAFTNDQLERYSRHIILKEVGAKGQKKLLNSSVLIIGAGGLGAPAALYLAAAGVGTIGIADADEVDLSNLQRQVIHATKDIGKPKVLSAKESMEAINPDVTVKTYQTFVDSETIMDLIKDYDFIIDGTDNFPAKFLINDACVMAKKPFSHAGILRFQGQLMFREKDHVTDVYSKIRRQGMPYLPVNRPALSERWEALSEAFRRWKQSNIFWELAIFLQDIFLHMMHLQWNSVRSNFRNT